MSVVALQPKKQPGLDDAVELERLSLVALRSLLAASVVESRLDEFDNSRDIYNPAETTNSAERILRVIARRGMAYSLFSGPSDNLPPIHIAVLVLAAVLSDDIFSSGRRDEMLLPDGILYDGMEPAAQVEAGLETDFDFVKALDELYRAARSDGNDFIADIAVDYLPPEA